MEIVKKRRLLHRLASSLTLVQFLVSEKRQTVKVVSRILASSLTDIPHPCKFCKVLKTHQKINVIILFELEHAIIESSVFWIKGTNLC